MKRAVTVFAILFVVGCATYRNLGEGDRLRTAALKAIGHEQVAWLKNDTAAVPAGMESLVSFREMRAYINRVSVADGTVTTTYWYKGTFATDKGQRDGPLMVQRRLHFTRSDSGPWTPSAPAEEIARRADYSARSAV